MVQERDIHCDDGRVLRIFDAGAPDAEASAGGCETGAGDAGGCLAVVWHHGSPHTGALIAPLLAAAAQRRVRLLAYARPGYGASSPSPGRAVAAAAHEVERLADAAGIARFAVMGYSGGGPHALACAALLPDRVTAAVSIAGLAPLSGGLDWFGGMASPGALQAAQAGRAARLRFAATQEFDESSFTAADWAALAGEWAPLGEDAGRAGAQQPEGLVDDDVAFVSPWGFDVTDIAAPVLLVHGGEDRVVPAAHSHWLLSRCPQAELWLRPRDGHVSVLAACSRALAWLQAHAGGR